MPSLFDEQRVLLELLQAVVAQRIKALGRLGYVTRGELDAILRTAITQVNEAEAKAS